MMFLENNEVLATYIAALGSLIAAAFGAWLVIITRAGSQRAAPQIEVTRSALKAHTGWHEISIRTRNIEVAAYRIIDVEIRGWHRARLLSRGNAEESNGGGGWELRAHLPADLAQRRIPVGLSVAALGDPVGMVGPRAIAHTRFLARDLPERPVTLRFRWRWLDQDSRVRSTRCRA